MADVLDLHPAAAARPEGPAYLRIQSASRLLATLFTAIAILYAAYSLAVLLFALIWSGPGGVYIGARDVLLSRLSQPPSGYVAFRGLAPLHQAAYVAVGLMRSAPALVIFWSLRRLLSLYAQGRVFTRENAVLIRAIGLWLVFDALAPAAGHLLLSAAGWEIDRRWMHFSSLQELILGGVVFLIALVMEAGREIEEERGQFV